MAHPNESTTMLTCPTCTKPANAPWRVYSENGHVVHGCVDAYHNGHLVVPSESATWHNRPAAKALRRAQAKALQSTLQPRRQPRQGR